MQKKLWSPADLNQMKRLGIREDKASEQLEMFRRGATRLVLARAVSPGDGLIRLPDNLLAGLDQLFREEAGRGRASIFVPASGAASRMFQLPLTFLNRRGSLDLAGIRRQAEQGEGEAAEILRILEGIRRFAFFPELELSLADSGLDASSLIGEGNYRPILEHLLTSQGLDYAGRPKALLTFHAYGDHARTAFEEHLVEAAAYLKDRAGICRLHLTVSPEFEDDLARHFQRIRGRFENLSSVKYEVRISTQRPETDTIAVDSENRPFRSDDGTLVFRPGGHGALIANLNGCGGDIVFIKNIDNVAPDRLKEPTRRYKTALGGYLVLLQGRLFDLLERLADGDRSASLIGRAYHFAVTELNIGFPRGFDRKPNAERAASLLERLNRPLRVCGMVHNRGEPGGGPFWVQEPDGTTSLQIVEKAQVDMNTESQRALLAQSEYFNPVDLVCGLRDYRGEQFDLEHYVDPSAIFISEKSHQGRALRALELPGLWNGAMARWNTVFVEVPLSTFNPVKTVLDLLRSEHQPE